MDMHVNAGMNRHVTRYTRDRMRSPEKHTHTFLGKRCDSWCRPTRKARMCEQGVRPTPLCTSETGRGPALPTPLPNNSNHSNSNTNDSNNSKVVIPPRPRLPRRPACLAAPPAVPPRGAPSAKGFAPCRTPPMAATPDVKAGN